MDSSDLLAFELIVLAQGSPKTHPENRHTSVGDLSYDIRRIGSGYTSLHALGLNIDSSNPLLLY